MWWLFSVDDRVDALGIAMETVVILIALGLLAAVSALYFAGVTA